VAGRIIVFMARHGWFDFLTRFRSTADEQTDEVQGLVLSGGGSRVSFQLGALRYLYGHRLIAPTRIVGTSGGSIVAAMLAQSIDPVKQAEALDELDRCWMAMASPDEMFTEQAWFTRLRSQAGDLVGLLGTAVEPPRANGRPNGGDGPIDSETLIRQALDDDPSRSVGWSASQVWQLLSALPRIGRAGANLATSVRGAGLAQSMYRPGPIVSRLLYEGSFSSENVRTSGVLLRIAMVGLNSGELHFMREDGRIVDRTDALLDGVEQTYDIEMGVWASCSIPGVFKPVRLGDEVYVDGGVRENVPVEMAVSYLGVTQPYVIVASPLGVHPDDYAERDIVSTLLRANLITSDEAEADEVEWARSAGAVVIDPVVNVHDAMTVVPALLRMNRDYGYMRAAEEVLGLAEAGYANRIAEARLKAWRMLDALDGGAADFESFTSDDLAVSLAEVRSLVGACDARLLPDGADTWGRETVE
jgi:predicted acylesterase/phospholipase RssA